MSRILLDLPDDQIEALALIVETEHRTRAAVIRDAIEAYIAARTKDVAHDVFGLWRERKKDGLVYQRELREEW
jgi:predicted transcriptional regulator